jgi:hypothetical protein
MREPSRATHPWRWMSALLVLLLAYVAVHSPALSIIAQLTGLRASRCYFACSGWIAGSQPGAAPAALLALALAVLGGWIAASWLPLRPADRPVAFGLVTLTLATVPAALIGLIGWILGSTPLKPPVGPLISALPAATLVGWAAVRGWRPRPPVRAGLRPAWLALVLLCVAVGLLSVLAFLSATHPPTTYDALSYHAPLAVYFWRDGNLGALLDRQPWAWALAHPGTAEIWFGLLRLAGGEAAANLGQLPFAFLGAVGLFAFALRLGAGRAGAVLGGLAFLGAPIVVLQSGAQLNDLAAGALLMAAVGLAASPPAGWTPARVALIGLALGLAATTKLAALPAVGGIGLAVLAGAGRNKRASSLAALSAGFAIAAGPWWVRNLLLYGNPVYPADIPFIGLGVPLHSFAKKDTWFLPGAWAWPLYPLVEPHNELSGMGALFAVGALPGLVVALRRARRWPLALYGALLALALPAWWFLTPREPRFLLGPLALAFGFIGWSLRAVGHRLRPLATGVLALAAVFSAFVTGDQALAPLARATADRARFYDVVWAIDSVAAGLPEEEGMLYHTGHAVLSYAGDYPLLGPGLGRTLIVIDGMIPTDSIASIMRRQRLNYAYVPAGPGATGDVESMYPAELFELVRVSPVRGGPSDGTRRHLFRLRKE